MRKYIRVFLKAQKRIKARMKRRRLDDISKNKQYPFRWTPLNSSLETPPRMAIITDAVHSMYEDEPCRVCGVLIGQLTKQVFAGYSACSKSRTAHKECWDAGIPKELWEFPIDG